jgi:hypothetical protein
VVDEGEVGEADDVGVDDPVARGVIDGVAEVFFGTGLVAGLCSRDGVVLPVLDGCGAGAGRTIT